MPFANTSDTEEFRFVNPDDPDGLKGLKPYSWNLLKDEDGNLVYGEDGVPQKVEPHGPQDSYWEFMAEMDEATSDIIVRKTAKTNWKFDRKEARRQGRNYAPTMEQQTLMSGLMALITTTSRGWHGPEFVIPKWFKDEGGRPHPQRGRLAPCTAFYIGKRPTAELRAVELFLQDLYEPEDEEEVTNFRQTGGGVGGPTQSGFGEEGQGQPGWEVAVPEGVDGLEGGQGVRLELLGDQTRSNEVEAATTSN